MEKTPWNATQENLEREDRYMRKVVQAIEEKRRYMVWISLVGSEAGDHVFATSDNPKYLLTLEDAKKLRDYLVNSYFDAEKVSIWEGNDTLSAFSCYAE